MNRDQAIAYLTENGNLRVPCSRYGTDSASCAPVAYDLALIFQEANGDEITADLLDEMMSRVVNDSDGPAELIRDHGTDEMRADYADFI